MGIYNAGSVYVTVTVEDDSDNSLSKEYIVQLQMDKKVTTASV